MRQLAQLLLTIVFLTPTLLYASVSEGEITSSVSSSDDFSTYKASFVSATSKLIDKGVCTLADFKEMGGWVKSQNHKAQPVYFTYCGGMHIKNRIYLDASSGKLFR